MNEQCKNVQLCRPLNLCEAEEVSHNSEGLGLSLFKVVYPLLTDNIVP